MPKLTDIRSIGAALYLIPVRTRMPLKFGPETLTEVTCARVRITVEDRLGRRAEGWGETPLSVQWAWPSALGVAHRLMRFIEFSRQLADLWGRSLNEVGHPMEIGHSVLENHLPPLWKRHHEEQANREEPMPWLAALIANSAFDLAIHDAFGKLHGIPIYDAYGSEHINRDLVSFFEGANAFHGQFPADFLVSPRPNFLEAWHLVGGKDPIGPEDLTGDEPSDGYPVLLRDWIHRDGLRNLKIKLTGTDAAWDFDRLVRVGRLAAGEHVPCLSADFNCTVKEPEYVNAILDRLQTDHPTIFDAILYVEQPFPYDLEAHPIDVLSVSTRKPLFLDESAHDWKMIRLGRSLGWTGVALKTCKTQTGAILSLCWAKAHGMDLMVQDLTNPMLAQIAHVLLAAHAGTIRGVETNAMQFYPEASRAEQAVHPGIYQRRNGCIDLQSIKGPGFGYHIDQIERQLPPPEIVVER